MITLPDPYRHRERLYATELAGLIARLSYCTPRTAKSRVYRAIESGRIQAVDVTGRWMIPITEALKFLNGETP